MSPSSSSGGGATNVPAQCASAASRGDGGAACGGGSGGGGGSDGGPVAAVAFNVWTPPAAMLGRLTAALAGAEGKGEASAAATQGAICSAEQDTLRICY